MCMFCRSLFVFLYFFILPLCCLFFLEIYVFWLPIWYLQTLVKPPTNFIIDHTSLQAPWSQAYNLSVDSHWWRKLFRNPNIIWLLPWQHLNIPENVFLKMYCCCPPPIRSLFLQWKNRLTRGDGLSWGGRFVVFYYNSVSEICPDIKKKKKGGNGLKSEGMLL